MGERLASEEARGDRLAAAALRRGQAAACCARELEGCRGAAGRWPRGGVIAAAARTARPETGGWFEVEADPADQPASVPGHFGEYVRFGTAPPDYAYATRADGTRVAVPLAAPGAAWSFPPGRAPYLPGANGRAYAGRAGVERVGDTYVPAGLEPGEAVTLGLYAPMIDRAAGELGQTRLIGGGRFRYWV
jgi:hypothetical protein